MDHDPRRSTSQDLARRFRAPSLRPDSIVFGDGPSIVGGAAKQLEELIADSLEEAVDGTRLRRVQTKRALGRVNRPSGCLSTVDWKWCGL